MADSLLPVHVQRDEDAAVGAAWRRCDGLIPAGAEWGVARGRGGLYVAWTDDPDHRYVRGEDPAAALTALAEALEARKAGS